MNASEVNRLLAGEYGDRPWRQHHDPLSELVATILSQNTSDVNSGRAFGSLLSAFGNWERVANADIEDIERAIRSGGLARIKAVRIKVILGKILEERGSLDLAFLDSLPIEDAKSWLRRLPGVGPKTAGCVLLFSLGKPALPVDTHVYRVAMRAGLIPDKVSVEQAHQLLENMVVPEDIYQFHMNMVEHGRKVCKSQRPKCSICVLRGVCVWKGSDSKDW